MTVPQKSRVDDEEDLDDLDDVLDQFSPSQAQPTPPPPSSASAGATTSTRPPESVDTELMDQFGKEMEELLKGLAADPSAAGSGGSDNASEGSLAAAWEAMLREEMNAMSGPSNSSASPAPKEDDFQSRIRSTMNKLKESESGLKSSDPSAGAGADNIDSLISQWLDMDLGDPNATGEDELSGILEGMMSQLMSKDVLYEPLKELYTKFPEYLEKNKSTTSTEDKTRYEAQISCIKRLLDVFEAKTYDDSDQQSREEIIKLMGELQTHGQPPEEIMGPLPPGLSMGADGPADGCKVD